MYKSVKLLSFTNLANAPFDFSVDSFASNNKIISCVFVCRCCMSTRRSSRNCWQGSGFCCPLSLSRDHCCFQAVVSPVWVMEFPHGLYPVMMVTSTSSLPCRDTVDHRLLPLGSALRFLT